MDELVRKALMGDQKSQEECTKKGILLPCPLCKGKVEYYFVKSYEEGWRGSIVVVPDKSYVVCKCGYGICEIGEKTAIKIHNTRPIPPIGRCKNCTTKEKATVNAKGFLICPVSGMEITDDDFCSYFEHKE